MSRYNQLVDLIRECKPSRIVEVGVHRGLRARLMCDEALRHSRLVHYIGYDVFETKDTAFQLAAMNGKGIATEAQARKTLDAIRAANPRFSYELVIGDTRKTLHGKSVEADFAFIDGDHRVEVIRGDHMALAHCDVIVFDDVIYPGPNGETVDTSTLGANVVIDAFEANAGYTVKRLPVKDRCNHGALAGLAVLRREIAETP